jgi:hypothetical protein
MEVGSPGHVHRAECEPPSDGFYANGMELVLDFFK